MIALFLQARSMLPDPEFSEFEIFIVSTGAIRASWSNAHVETSSPPASYTFIKVTDIDNTRYRWKCLDKGMEKLLLDSNLLAVMALNRCMT